MKANFQLSGDVEIEVQDNQVRKHVLLRIVTTEGEGDDARRREREVGMHKSAARAIASALMGCASQID